MNRLKKHLILFLLMSFPLSHAGGALGKFKPSLIKAAREGDLAEVKKFIDLKSDVNATDKKGRTALMRAACFGHEEIVEQLLKTEAQVDIQDRWGNTALHYASHIGNLKIAKLLLDAEAQVLTNKEGNSPIHYASKNYFNRRVWNSGTENLCWDKYSHVSHDSELLSIMLRSNVEINAQDLYGNTALHHACKCGSRKKVLMLLEAGADPNIKNKEGFTPISIPYHPVGEDDFSSIVCEVAHWSIKNQKKLFDENLLVVDKYYIEMGQMSRYDKEYREQALQ